MGTWGGGEGALQPLPHTHPDPTNTPEWQAPITSHGQSGKAQIPMCEKEF